MSVNEKMTAIANAIREKTKGTKPLTLDDMATGINDVFREGYDDGQQEGFNVGYNAGEANGFNRGYDEGYKEGKKSEWDTFWDAYQDNGNRTNYERGFSGCGWTDVTFRPQYDIRPVGAYCTTSLFQASKITNLKQILENCDVVLDLSNITRADQIFQGSTITHLPKIDLSKCTSLSYVFYSGSIVHIDEVVFNDTVIIPATVFGTATALEHLRISGTIGTSINLGSSPLDVESAKSVINALKDYMGTSEDLTYKLTLKSTVWDALNAAGPPPHSETWQRYVNSKGWQCA